MILYGSSLADGNEHGDEDLPLLLAGRGGNTIKTGREIAFEGQESLSKLHLSMLQRMGVNAEEFADAEHGMTEIDA